MNNKEAKELVEKNLHLIGKEYSRATIDELIIYPVDSDDFEEFCKLYLRTMKADISSKPFANRDLSVGVVVNKDYIIRASVFLHTDIANLPDKLGAVLK